VWAADWAAASQWWLNQVVGVPAERIFGDMNNRKFTADGVRDTNMNQQQVTLERHDDLDLYVCGFPRTPFSSKGKQLGFDDVNNKPFWFACKPISAFRPKVVVLENVMGIMRKGGLNKVLEVLRVITGYASSVLVGASNHQYGIPQHRPRIYVVMIRRNSLRSHLADQHLQERMEHFLDCMKVASPVTWPTFLQRVGLPVATNTSNLTIRGGLHLQSDDCLLLACLQVSSLLSSEGRLLARCG
jgi:site-specific DNA-cytosine methylase